MFVPSAGLQVAFTSPANGLQSVALIIETPCTKDKVIDAPPGRSVAGIDTNGTLREDLFLAIGAGFDLAIEKPPLITDLVELRTE